MIIEICKGWTEAHRFFLYEDEYNRRIENKEPIIQSVPNKLDFYSLEIITMDLEGNFLFCSPNSLSASNQLKISKQLDISKSVIVRIAKGRYTAVGDYRFAFKFVYDEDPDSFKIMNSAILKFIDKRNKLKNLTPVIQTPTPVIQTPTPTIQPLIVFTREQLQNMDVNRISLMLSYAKLSFLGEKGDLIDRYIKNQPQLKLIKLK